MRILHLLASPVFSGPAENLTLLAAAQRSLGHDVSIAVDRKRPGLSSEEPLVPRLRALHLLDGGEDGLELSVKSAPWEMARDVFRLRRRSVDVVHSHFSHDHVVARSAALLGMNAVLVRSIHAPRSLRHLPRADGYTVPTEVDVLHLPRGRAAMALPALVASEFTPLSVRADRQRALGVEGTPTIGMVSTFQPSRGHLLALEAFALVHRANGAARLVLVGDGELEAQLRERTGALGLSRAVTFAGYQSGGDFVRWLQALDEVWVFGLGNDWSARVAAQARACGARVIAVEEGALSLHSTTSIPRDLLSAERVAAASLAVRTQDPGSAAPVNEAIARQVLELYRRAGVGAR